MQNNNNRKHKYKSGDTRYMKVQVSGNVWIKGMDFEDQPVIATIEDAWMHGVWDSEENKEVEKLVVGFEELEGLLVLNKTQTRKLIALFGDESDEWKGKEVVLESGETALGQTVVIKKTVAEPVKASSKKAQDEPKKGVTPEELIEDLFGGDDEV